MSGSSDVATVLSLPKHTSAQWIALESSTNPMPPTSIWITSVSLDWGKLYDGNDKDHEIGIPKVIGTQIKLGKSYTIWACGRENASSGTEGTVTLSTVKTGGSKIASVYWDCP